jgi:hypothetical protein
MWTHARKGAGAIVCVLILASVASTGAYGRTRTHGPSGHRAQTPTSTGHGRRLARRRRVAPRRPKRPPPLSADATDAIASYEAMQKYFYVGGSELYREELGSSSNSYLWPFSQAIAATISVANIRGERAKAAFTSGAQIRGLQKYLSNAPPSAVSSTEALQSLPHYTATIASAGPGGTTYYDDNDWVGIEMVRLFEFTHDEAALALAEQILSFEESGWQSSPNNLCPGGIPHSDSEEDEYRSTITTAPAAELAVQLYRITHNDAYLAFAENAYEWVHRCLLMTSGLYADHLEANGEVDPELWSYTQGVMIGAGALLYQVTGNGGYLSEAEASANIAVSAWPLDAMGGENPFFAAVFLRNLIYLDAIIHSATGDALAQQYVDWALSSLHEPNGLFTDKEGGKTTLQDQAAFTQIYALLSTNPATFF